MAELPQDLMVWIENNIPAKEFYESAILKCPNNAQLYQSLAYTCVMLEDNEGARKAAQKALEINPNQPKSLACLAGSEYALGKSNYRRC